MAIEFEARRSIFDPEYSFSYEEYFKPFLEHFVGDISKPIRKTDNEIGYVPTQVFTEFIKSINFRKYYYWSDGNGKESNIFINGVQFKSSIMKDGMNLVLFRGPEISTTDSAGSNDAWLFYKGNRTYQVTEIRVNSERLEAQTGVD